MVREPSTVPRPTSRPPSRTPPPDDDDDDGDVTDNIPTVPLPDEAGEATDEVKDRVDDITGNLPLP